MYMFYNRLPQFIIKPQQTAFWAFNLINKFITGISRTCRWVTISIMKRHSESGSSPFPKQLICDSSSEESGDDIQNFFTQSSYTSSSTAVFNFSQRSSSQSQPWPNNMELPFSDASEKDAGSIFGKSSKIEVSAILNYQITCSLSIYNLILKLFDFQQKFLLILRCDNQSSYWLEWLKLYDNREWRKQICRASYEDDSVIVRMPHYIIQK